MSFFYCHIKVDISLEKNSKKVPVLGFIHLLLSSRPDLLLFGLPDPLVWLELFVLPFVRLAEPLLWAEDFIWLLLDAFDFLL